MSKIMISPFSRVLRNGKKNPKDYCYWEDLLKNLKIDGHYLIQIGTQGEVKFKGIVDEIKFNLSLDDLGKLVDECDIWIGVDNFFPHFCNLRKKFGIVLFGQSDPEIFGYKENINILKDKKYLREKQFDIWECTELNDEAFVRPSKVIEELSRRI